MTRPHSICFRLSISTDKYLSYYKGLVNGVSVKAEDGRQIRFPANAVQRFLSHEGIYGRFEIHFDENNKLVGIERIGD